MNYQNNCPLAYSLNTPVNYFKTILNSQHDILNKYSLLVLEYINFIIETMNEKKMTINRFTIERGLETITHVFTILLYTSKNVDMAYYHSQKSFYFFIEFIEQISEEQHTFLNLSSRDATMFVYKKTIFEIINDKKNVSIKMEKIDTDKLELLNTHVDIFQNIICYNFQKIEFCSKNTCMQQLKEMIINIKKVNDKLLNSSLLNKDFDDIQTFILFLNMDINIDLYYSIINLFIKTYFKPKNDITKIQIREKFSDDCYIKKLLDGPHDKFIKWMFV